MNLPERVCQLSQWVVWFWIPNVSSSLLSLREVLDPVRRDPMPHEPLYSQYLRRLPLSPSSYLSSLFLSSFLPPLFPSSLLLRPPPSLFLPFPPFFPVSCLLGIRSWPLCFLGKGASTWSYVLSHTLILQGQSLPYWASILPGVTEKHWAFTQ